MRLQETERNIETKGVLSEGNFGILAGDQAHILVILRDKLYSDKFTAVLREYGCNATDAHVDAGIKDRPIKVKLPNRWEPVLSIRDFGLGLSREDVYNLYTKYGRSTKRDSNDVIGQLGLGCKSGFAYTNTFTIISHHGGTKTTYVAYIDETNVGKVSELKSEPSNETGIEIQLPVQAAHVDTFIAKAQSVFAYFSPVPDINTHLKKPEYTVRGTNWSIRTEFGQGPQAIMGNIAYPIDSTKLPELSSSGKEVLETGIDIFFGIGELSISASRESLEYTDLTRQSIYKKLAIVRNEVLASLKREFEECTDVWQARELFQKTQRSGRNDNWNYNYGQARGRSLVATLAASTFKTWNGIDIATATMTFTDHLPDKLSIRYLPSSNMRTADSKSTYRRTVTIQPSLVIFKNDTKTSWLQKALHWRGSNLGTQLNGGIPHPVTRDLLVADWKGDVTDPAFDAAITKYCEKHGITGITIQSADAVVLPAVVNTAVTAQQTAVKVRAKAKVFKLVKDYAQNRYPASSNWEPAEVDLEEATATYTIIHAFKPTEKEAEKYLMLLTDLGLDLSTVEVYGIREEMQAKLGPNWTSFNTWAQAKVQDLLGAYPDKAELISFYVLSSYSIKLEHKGDLNPEVKRFIGLVSDPRIGAAANYLRDVQTQCRNLSWTKRETFQRILSNTNDAIMAEASHLLKNVVEVSNDYPLLKEVNFFSTYYALSGPGWPEALADYIELKRKNKEENK